MSQTANKNTGTEPNPSRSREWIAPELVVLNADMTAGGTFAINTTEAFNYHPS